jgi:uroporphyrin-III C-methyltransferase
MFPWMTRCTANAARLAKAVIGNARGILRTGAGPGPDPSAAVDSLWPGPPSPPPMADAALRATGTRLTALATLLRSAVATRRPVRPGPVGRATRRHGSPRDTTAQGHIALVGAGPGAADLLTLRALRRLQEADVIFYDRLVDPAVLDMARPAADRVFVGKAVGANAWPQDRINGVILAAARQGRRVVRLKSGDPGIFGRASEELQAARAAGIPVEIVPGVTAACAAAASLGRSLTERGVTDTLVLATGTCRPGDAAPDWASRFHPGTTLALYMAATAAPEVRDCLRAAGAPANCAVTIVTAAQSTAERTLRGSLEGLGALTRGITGSAMILIDWPKSLPRDVTHPQAPRLLGHQHGADHLPRWASAG